LEFLGQFFEVFEPVLLPALAAAALNGLALWL
jgi:hypothetical protein